MRLLTLNIGSVEPDWARRTSEIALWLTRTAPDVIALQEVSYRNAVENSMTDIFEHMHHDRYIRHFAGNPARTADGRFGVALLSRIPPSDTGYLDLPTGPDAVAQHSVAWMQIGGIRFYSAHLAADPHNSVHRLAQVDILRREVRSLQGQPVVLSGDLNCEPTAPAIRRLLAPPSEKEPWLIDLWQALHPDLPGFTWDSARNSLAHTRNGPRRRLDYILSSAAVQAATISVVCNSTEGDSFPSDHYGLLAELSLRV